MRGLLFLIVTLLGVQASADTSNFIPNYYRSHKDLNNFSAIGWSSRHEVELIGQQANYAQDSGGVRQDDGSQKSGELQGYYRLANDVNLEARTENVVTTTDYPSFGQSKTALLGLRASAGYELTNSVGLPLAFGVSVSQANRDFTNTNSEVSTFRSTQVQIGAGYRLADDIYLGLGYVNFRSTGQQIGHSYSIGAGKVFGDKKAPTAAVETFVDLSNNNAVPTQGLTGRGLYNFLAFQFYGNLHYFVNQRANRSETHEGTVGMDYEFFNFYVGPEYTYFEQSSNDRSSESENVPSLEAGYRTARLEAFLRYGLDRVNESFSSGDAYLSTRSTTLGFIYKF